MAHWKLTPKQVSKLTDDELYTMVTAFRMYEKRGLESLSDLIGTLTGTSWSVDALVSTPEDEMKEMQQDGFKWSLRPPRQRVSLPLSLVVGGNKVLEHVKKVAATMKDKAGSSIISLPRGGLLKGAEVVDLGRVSKDQFLKFAQHASPKKRVK